MNMIMNGTWSNKRGLLYVEKQENDTLYRQGMVEKCKT
jgi:hypothetical protein